MVGLSSDIRADVVAAYRVVDPYFHYNDHCHACIVDMMKTVYSYYKKQKQ